MGCALQTHLSTLVQSDYGSITYSARFWLLAQKASLFTRISLNLQLYKLSIHDLNFCKSRFRHVHNAHQSTSEKPKHLQVLQINSWGNVVTNPSAKGVMSQLRLTPHDIFMLDKWIIHPSSCCGEYFSFPHADLMSLSAFRGAWFETPPLLSHSRPVLSMRFHGSAIIVHRGSRFLDGG